MPFYVYACVNPEGKIYKGMTSNLEERMRYHNSGLSRWTKHRGPWKLFYSETHQTKKQALLRERFLKSGKGRELLKGIIEV